MFIYYLLMLLSIVLAVCKSSVYNSYAKKTKPSLFATFGFNAITYGAATLFALVAMLFGSKTLSLPTLFCAMGYAIIVFSLQTISVTAMKSGAMVLTSICVMYGLIIPSLIGPIFYEEDFHWWQGVGIAVMLVSLWLLRGKPSNKKNSISLKWIILASVAFVLSGMAGVMEKIHQDTYKMQDESAMFVFFACIFMFCFSIIASLVTYRKQTASAVPKSVFLFGAIAGAIVGLYSLTNLTLAGNLPTMVCYPITNGGAMLLTVLVSAVVFKEPLDWRKVVGTIIGIGGIICLGIIPQQ